ncbi:DUF350 domain-containing protein [Thalassoroseus pseudoceratinae]|uniref:DUF350 domain-containing protein n=1 Tax=Thalassoroseus pseudoceratinae TaxID=2713176 RepID=UPI0019807D1B|nr:DUF350 domain-containing protein [Thalassoroseus pseudoceratinae]
MNSWMNLIGHMLAATENEVTNGPAPPTGSPMENLVPLIISALVFTTIGVLLFAICLWLIVKLSPFSIRKEIEEDQNTSLGIIIGSMILGIALILAAAIHG